MGGGSYCIGRVVINSGRVGWWKGGLGDWSNAHREPGGALRGSVGEQLGRLSSIDIAHWWGLVEYIKGRGGTVGMG